MKDVPDWLLMLATFAGLTISTIVARLGWNRAGQARPVEDIPVSGGLIDSKSVRTLTDCIDKAVDDITESGREQIKAKREQTDAAEELIREIKKLRETIIDALEKLQKR